MSDENTLANKIAKDKLNKAEEKQKQLWELSKDELDTKLNSLTFDELVAEQNTLSGVTPSNKKQKKAIEKTRGVIADKITRRRMEAPSGGGRVTSEVTTTTKPKTSTTTTTKTTTTKTTPAPAKTSSTEKRLDNVVEEGDKAADELNSEELSNKKAADAQTAAENAKKRSLFVDDSLEFNSPNWFWKEAREIAPTDKAKRGFLITNHVFNTLGTGLGNIGATVQNNGGSGGGTFGKYNSYIDQYRQSKLDQLMANRKAKQDNMLQQQINAIMAIGASEEEVIKIQNRLRNAEFKNKYNRLSNEEQVLLQALLYYDNQGKIGDALLGDMIDRMLKGEKVSAEDTITTVLTSSGIDDAATLKNKINNFAKDPVSGLKKGVATIFGYNLPEE